MTLFTEFRVKVGTPVKLGDDGFGEARIVPILGGTVEGPGLTGTILSGGADEQRVRADGLTRIHARYVIEAADGALIRVDSQGLRHGPPEVIAALQRGETVDHGQIYFRTVIRFETAAPAHDFLNLALFQASGRRLSDTVLLSVSRL